MENDNLRGFAGFNTVHINIKYWKNRHQGHDLIDDTIAKLDFATLALHETLHCLSRSLENNLNLSTPEKIKKLMNSSIPEDDREGGRLMELEIFGFQPNWWKALGGKVSQERLILIFEALQDPDRANIQNLVEDLHKTLYRKPSMLFGIDMLFDEPLIFD